MRKQIQFKVSFIAAAISMIVAGSARALPPDSNNLVGPDMNTSGVATVKIEQSGTGNITSKTGSAAGGAFIVDQLAGATTVLTIQQVGIGNTLGLSSFTNDTTSVQVFQGADAADGNTGNLGAIASNAVSANQAVIGIGKDSTDAGRAQASNVFLTQQGDGNVAGLHLGQAAGVFTGTLNLIQAGASNIANVTIDGQTTTGQTFNIGQSGSTNALTLVANGDQTTGITFALGDMTIGQTTSRPAVDFRGNLNNAATFNYATDGSNAALQASFTGSFGGIQVLGTDELKISASGSSNNVQVDLLGAQAMGNRIDVKLNGSSLGLAVYGTNSAAFNLGGASSLTIRNGGELVAYANGGAVSVNNVDFYGDSYLSTNGGGSITMSGGSVSGMSVVQSGAAHTFSSTNGTFYPSTWNVSQTGPVGNSITANNTVTDARGTFTLTQASETGAGAHSMTLNNTALNYEGVGTTWTVTQTGAGAKFLGFTNSTDNAMVTASQTGASTQTASGIDFAAASLSTFTLVQR